MRTLSFDPGHTVGIAILNSEGELEVALTVPHKSLGGRNFFTSLTRMAQAELVLIEAIPSTNVDQITFQVYVKIKSWYEIAGFQVRVVSPGSWKGILPRQKIPGQHQVDAFNMASWYLTSNKERKP